MSKRSFIIAVVLGAVAITVVAPSVVAERVEVTPFIGYRWGGAFKGGNYDLMDVLLGDNLKFDAAPNFGIIVDIKLKKTVQLEIFYDRQQTHLVWENPRTGTDTTITDMSVNYLQAGVLFETRRDQWRPFAVITIGASIFDPQGGFDAETRFSGGFAVGTKYFFNNRWGLRIQSRLMSTWMWSSGDVFTGPDGNSYTHPSDTYSAQIDISGGVVIRI